MRLTFFCKKELLSLLRLLAKIKCSISYSLIADMPSSYKMPGCMKYELESGLPGEISVTSDTQMTPPLSQKAKN